MRRNPPPVELAAMVTSHAPHPSFAAGLLTLRASRECLK
jgi:hypothetical protein